MKIDPRHLEILSAIVENGGLTEGADAVGRSQPSVSRTVAMLEARLGTHLFEKNRRPLMPTELCLSLAAEGHRISSAGATAAAIVQNYKAGHKGVVRIGGTPVFMDGVISSLIAEFQMAFPQVRIEQSYGYAEKLMHHLTSGTLDLAVCPMNVEAVPEGFVFVPLMPGRNVIACGVSHPLLRKRPLRVADIAPYPWIAPPATSPLNDDMRKVLADIGLHDFKISFSGGTLASTTTILARSDALTILPYSVVFMARRQQNLAALPIRIGHPDRSLGILTRVESSERPAVRRFKRFIDSEFQNVSDLIMQRERNTVWRS
jgi:DNA-binding transcriptional LysR family regulator